jgi:hypothetical protein
MKTLFIALLAFMLPVAALVVMRRDDLENMIVQEQSASARAGHVYFFTAPG